MRKEKIGCSLSDSIISEAVLVIYTVKKINFLPEGHTCRQFLCCLRKNALTVMHFLLPAEAAGKMQGTKGKVHFCPAKIPFCPLCMSGRRTYTGDSSAEGTPVFNAGMYLIKDAGKENEKGTRKERKRMRKKGKFLKRISACLMAAALLISSGCGSTSTTGSTAADTTEAAEQQAAAGTESGSEEGTQAQTETEESMYPLQEKVHLTLAMVEEPAVTANAADLAATPFGQAWQEATGVELEIMQLADNDALNLLYASGDLPDMIAYHGYTGGPEKAVKDQIIEPLNEYMKYAPDLQAVMDSNDLWRRSNMTADGDIIGFPFIRGDKFLQTSVGLMVRKDWLDDLGLEVPQTADELYEVLKAFKEEKGAEVPFSAGSYWFRNVGIEHGIFTSPFGLVKAGFYQVDGTVHYGYAEEEYKGVLEYLNKLYTEGLLDPNFQTIDDNAVRANIMNGQAGVTVGNTGGYMGTMLETMKNDPNFDLAGFGPLVANRGDTAMSTHYDAALPGDYVIITPACQNKEAAVKFLNYGYTEAGNMLFNFGIEGVSYTIEDGKPVYTDLIMNNPEGLTKQLALAQYTRAWQNGPFVQDRGYIEQYCSLPQQQEALTNWTTSDAEKYAMPPVSVSEADATEYSKLSGDINTYISEMTIRYITGLESLDTFESGYLATLESMGVDRLIELQQTALDDFNAR